VAEAEKARLDLLAAKAE